MVGTGVPLLHRNVIRMSVTIPSKTRLTVGAGPGLTWVGLNPGSGSQSTSSAVGPVQRHVAEPPGVSTVRSTGVG